MKSFRLLRADEIEVRVSQIAANGLMLLLYKDARCDQNILDETVGSMRWQRHHSRDNANCVVAIYDDELKQWIEKEDTGTESNTEAEKGLASDSFKRACVNWGIGRELYSAPQMWFPRNGCNVKEAQQAGGKPKCFDRFIVTDIRYDENENIAYVRVENVNTGAAKVYGEMPIERVTKQEATDDEKKPYVDAIIKRCNEDGIQPAFVWGLYGTEDPYEIDADKLARTLSDKAWTVVKQRYVAA